MKTLRWLMTLWLVVALLVSGVRLARAQTPTPPAAEVILSWQVEPAVVTLGQEDLHVALTVQPGPVACPTTQVSAPLDIVLVVDRSSSMDDLVAGGQTKFDYAVQAI
ncbi:MAG: VWA domain-containing protein [Chloroflexi bacterium]|nr:MAG: VWA domain-containing protein [Chloroflexota bacterium]